MSLVVREMISPVPQRSKKRRERRLQVLEEVAGQAVDHLLRDLGHLVALVEAEGLAQQLGQHQPRPDQEQLLPVAGWGW